MWALLHIPKVSERQACELAHAFCKELRDGSETLESSNFLDKLARLHETGHEHRVPALLEQFGLQARVPVTWVDVGLPCKHPVLRLQDLLRGLSEVDKVAEHFLHGHAFEDYELFWSRYKVHRPCHPVFSKHSCRLRFCIPLFVHTDEGTGQKKDLY